MAQNYVYKLALDNNKFYVGRTCDYKKRIQEHKDKKACSWTTIYPLSNVLKIFKTHNDFDEDKYTLEMMYEHGIDNVRGGSFVSIILKNEEKELIQRMIKTAKNKCFICGSVSHFSNECKNTIDNSMTSEVIDYNIFYNIHPYIKAQKSCDETSKKHIESLINEFKFNNSLYHLFFAISNYFKKSDNIILLHSISGPDIINFLKKIYEKLTFVSIDDELEANIDILIPKKNRCIYYSRDIPFVNYIKYFDRNEYRCLIPIDLSHIDYNSVDKLKLDQINIDLLLERVDATGDANLEDEINKIRICNDYIYLFMRKETSQTNKMADCISIDDFIKRVSRFYNSYCKKFSVSKVKNKFVTKARILEYFEYHKIICKNGMVYGYKLRDIYMEFINQQTSENVNIKHDITQLCSLFGYWFSKKYEYIIDDKDKNDQKEIEEQLLRKFKEKYKSFKNDTRFIYGVKIQDAWVCK